MTPEYREFAARMEHTRFTYAHLTGALEIYDLILRDKELQKKCFGGVEWKTIYRFQNVPGQPDVWFPPVSIEVLIANMEALKGRVYGFIWVDLVTNFEEYLLAVLERVIKMRPDADVLREFSQRTGITLEGISNYERINELRIERHKIIHNLGVIDAKYFRQTKLSPPPYRLGDTIQKSHLEVLDAFKLVEQFVRAIDTIVEQRYPVGL